MKKNLTRGKINEYGQTKKDDIEQLAEEVDLDLDQVYEVAMELVTISPLDDGRQVLPLNDANTTGEIVNRNRDDRLFSLHCEDTELKSLIEKIGDQTDQSCDKSNSYIQ